MPKKRILLPFTLCCLLLLIGCATTISKSSDPTQVPALEPAALLKFADIPVPAVFKFTPDESYAFQAAGFRAALLKYNGKATGEQAVVFFKEQMPLYNWRLLNIVEHGRRMLSFEKEDETCIITIDEKGNRSGITVSVAPKSQFSPRKAPEGSKTIK
jgi:hypothetical protein